MFAPITLKRLTPCHISFQRVAPIVHQGQKLHFMQVVLVLRNPGRIAFALAFGIKQSDSGGRLLYSACPRREPSIADYLLVRVSDTDNGAERKSLSVLRSR